ncbi:MAG: hypothetical protein ACOVNM_07950 [Flavobacterium sp.]|jgi:hypothetical protein
MPDDFRAHTANKIPIKWGKYVGVLIKEPKSKIMCQLMNALFFL